MEEKIKGKIKEIILQKILENNGFSLTKIAEEAFNELHPQQEIEDGDGELLEYQTIPEEYFEYAFEIADELGLFDN